MVSPSRSGARKTFGGAQLLRALCFVAGSSAAAASSPLAAQTSEGKEVFKLACVACHGEDGRGGPGGGAPLEKVTDATMVAAMVTDGRGNMPPLAEALTAEQIRAVAAYVVNGLFEQKSP